MKKTITVGIPAYKAESTICDLLSSIQIQTIKDDIAVIIASDNPSDDYQFVKSRYPELDITILSCSSNTGPGLARQRALDACKTDWITFADADDIFIHPMALESFKNNITPNCIEVQGPFFQEIKEGNVPTLQRHQMLQSGTPVPPRMTARNDVQHPWVFGRCYNVKFLRDNSIEFSQLRAMEDGEFNWKIRMMIEGSRLQINKTEDPIYLWRTGSDHSITRIGADQNKGVPLYNWDLCPVGSTAASINAIQFCKKRNPFNGSILRFTVEMMIRQYFTYVQCIEKCPMFADQNLFNAKRFYHTCYQSIEDQIDSKILNNMYTIQYSQAASDMIGIIPSITFFDFMKMLSESEFGSEEEFQRIRDALPEWVTELDKKSGVLGEEGYVYTTCEKGGDVANAT